MNKINLEIVTPDKIAYCESAVEAINVPGTEGYLGILPDHTPLFTRLTEGEVKITVKGEEIYLAIGGGFLEVNHNKVTILVTRAVHAKELNEKEILAAQKRAFEMLKTKPSGDTLLEAQSLYRRSLLDLKILHKRKKRSSDIPY